MEERLHDLNVQIVKESMVIGKLDQKQPYPYSFAPTFHRYRLDEPKHWKTPRTIFVCSMADLFGEWVPEEWIRQVMEACKAAPQHRYLFLTKNPMRYIDLCNKGILPQGDHFWYGSTATAPDTAFFFCKGLNTFVSIEPILKPFSDEDDFLPVDWVIVGAETGNRKGKVIPEKAWIDEVVKEGGWKLYQNESIVDVNYESK